MQKSHNLHLKYWMKAVIDNTEESDLSKTLVDQTDSVDSVFHTSFIHHNNTELVKHQCEEVKAEKLAMKKK